MRSRRTIRIWFCLVAAVLLSAGCLGGQTRTDGAPSSELRHEADDPPYVIETQAPSNATVTVRLTFPNGSTRTYRANGSVRELVELNETGAYRMTVETDGVTTDHAFDVAFERLADCNKEAKLIVVEDGAVAVEDYFEQAGCADPGDRAGPTER